jgi:hypothetical protein
MFRRAARVLMVSPERTVRVTGVDMVQNLDACGTELRLPAQRLLHTTAH